MRQDNVNFAERNKAESREPRFVVRVEFATNDSIYLCSHDVDGLTGDNVYEDALVNLSGTSQKLDPKKANSEIGSFNFEVLDDGLTNVTRTKLRQEDKGLKGKTVEAYVGAADLDWSDYILVTTQIIEQATFSERKYAIKCADIQRRMREDIFEIRETALASTLEADATTVEVFTTSGIERRYQPNISGTDAPGQKVGYLHVENNDEYEIIRYTGKTDTAFTGCTRGVLGTQPLRVEKTGDTDADNAPKVAEYVYLEMPAPMLAYALLTGALYGIPGETLPERWHLGIDPAFVRTADYTNIGTDLWDPDDLNKGLVSRIEDVDGEDGKQFIEEQLFRMMGCYPPIFADGQIGLRRMTGVLSQAGYVRELNEDNIVSYGDLTHVMEDVINLMAVHWNYVPRREDFTRTNVLQDPLSIERHGQADVYEIELRGLHGSRHSYETIKNIFDSLRDRYAGPPLTLSLTLTPDQNDLEIGDIVRVRLGHIQDFTGETRDGHLDRNFEIQKISTDWTSGEVKVELFGSSQKASELAPEEHGSGLPDSWYTAEGTEINDANFGSAVSVGSNVTTVVGDITLDGGTDLNDASSVFWCGQDLAFEDDVTVTINNNVQIRVAGFFDQNNAKIDGRGRGPDGGDGCTQVLTFSDSGEMSDWQAANIGTGGFLQSELKPQGGIYINPRPSDPYQLFSTDWNAVGGAAKVSGQYQSAPTLELDFDADNNALNGIPSTLWGSSGSGGGALAKDDVHGPDGIIEAKGVKANGGNGGNGGAGLFIVSRGMSTGENATIDLSGDDGQMGGTEDYQAWENFSNGNTGVYTAAGGTGAPGYPGALYVIVDGETSNPPTLSGFERDASQGLIFETGLIPWFGVRRESTATQYFNESNPSPQHFSGYYGLSPSSKDSDGRRYNIFDAAHRVQRLTGSIEASPDVPEDAPQPSSITLQELTNTPESAKANLSTIEVSVSAPSANNYSHSLVEYRVQGSTDGWHEVGPTAPEATFVVTSDGTTYEVRARPVSTSGKVGPSGPSDTITTTDMVNNPDPGDVDNVAPLDPVTGLQVENGGTEFTGRDCKVVWSDPNRTNLNELEYKVEILDGATVVRTETVNSPNYVYTSEKNAEDYAAQNDSPGRWRAFEIRVRVIGYVQTSSGLQESSPVSISVSNPAPALPNALNISAAFRMIEIDFEQPSDLDYKELKVWISQTSGFVRDGSTLKATKAGGPINIEGLTAGTTYYLRVATYDDFGEGTVSSEFVHTTERLSANDITDALTPSMAGRAMRGNTTGDQFIPVADVAVAGGTANAITADMGLDAYNSNQVITIQATATNTGAVTLELDGLGVVDVKLPDGNDLPADIIMAERLFRVWYDGSKFILLDPTVHRVNSLIQFNNVFVHWANQQTLDGDVRSLTYGDGIFVAGTSGGASVWTSTDSQSWINRQSLDSIVQSLTHGDGIFIAGTSVGSIWTSTDSQSWTNQQSLESAVESLTYGDGVYVAGTGTGTLGADSIWTSTDGGQSWTNQQSLDGAVVSLAYGNGVFVAGTEADSIWTSTDGGQSWTNQQSLDGTVWSLAYGSGIFVAGTGGASVWTSTDSQSWINRQSLDGDVRSLTYGDGIFVAGTYGDSVWTSTDARLWANQQSLDGDGRSLAYGDGIFVAGTTGTDSIWTPFRPPSFFTN